MAWSLGFQVNGKYAYYQQTFDIDSEEYAPGEVLLHYLLLYVRENVKRELDFLRGDEFFKKRFATHINQNLSIYLERPSAGGQLRRLRRSVEGRFNAAKNRIQGFVRTHETIFRIFRSVYVWKRTAVRRLQWARQSGELSNYALGSCFDLFRNLGWSKTVATVFQKEDRQELVALPACLVSDPETSVAAGRLSDLTDLALEHPEIPFLGFRECRNRLKNGDQVYLVHNNDELALVAWAGTRPVRRVSNVTSPSAASAGKTAVAMYECWPISNPGPGCAQLLAMLATEASKTGTDLLVCCPAVPCAHRVELNRHGFLPKSRIVGHRMLRWLHHDSVRDCPVPQEQPAGENDSCPKLRKRSKL